MRSLLEQTSLYLVFIPLLAACANTQVSPMPASPITLTFTLQTPTPGWTIAPLAAYRVHGEHWCIHQLTPPEGMTAQMISKATSTISFVDEFSGKTPARHYVRGKTWAWNSNPEITYIDSIDSLKEALADATELPLITLQSKP